MCVLKMIILDCEKMRNELILVKIFLFIYLMCAFRQSELIDLDVSHKRHTKQNCRNLRITTTHVMSNYIFLFYNMYIVGICTKMLFI